MCSKKDYGLHCHLFGDHNIHKHLILCLHLLKSLPPGALEKSSITDQISFLTPVSMSLRQNCSNILQTQLGSVSSSAQSARCRDMGVFHRHYLLYRHAQECLHNLQPKSGCVLPMHSLLQTKFFCRSSCAADFCLRFYMRTTRRW